MVFSLSIYLGFLCTPLFFLGPLLEDPEQTASVVILVAIVLACVGYAQRMVITLLCFSFSLPRFSFVIAFPIIWQNAIPMAPFLI